MIARMRVRRFVLAATLPIVVLAMLRVWPHAPLMQRFPLSTGVWSADGELLRVTRATDDQYRLWVPLSRSHRRWWTRSC